MCSTPFGIVGIFTRIVVILIIGALLCSTPFGIVGIFTNTNRNHFSDSQSAQRLSASLESSRRARREQSSHVRVLNAFRHRWNLHSSNPVYLTSNMLCSTPFGIVGIFTPRESPRPARASAVLNAFRHRWNLHCSQAAELGRQSCAQRLSASLESSRQPRVRPACSRFCAQRLSASLESSPSRRLMSLIGFSMCSTPFGIVGIFTSPGRDKRTRTVSAQRLSASLESSLAVASIARIFATCAQRLSASLESSLGGLLLTRILCFMCSTPFGIVGIFT